MPLKIDQQEKGSITLLRLAGELDTATSPQLAPVMEGLAANTPPVLVLNLSELHYISSAGLRYVFQMKKLMKSSGGEFVISEPSPQVRKVFDIVKAVPVQSVFASAAELDDYLDKMQRQVSEGEG
jgi:anti-anti-sigma factor